MINIFHVSLPNFSLKNIRKLVDLLDWIRWTDFSANSSYQITRAFAGIVGKVTQMNDPMAGKIITSSATHMRDLTKEIKTELKNITVFIRERYKWRVREELINRMDIDPEQYKRNPPDVMNNVKFEFAHNPKKLGWYKDLVKELLDEDFGEQFESKRQAALDRLKVARASEKKKKKNGPDDRATLLGIVDKMARSGEPIRSAIVKMNENSRNIQDRKKSFGERLSEIIQTLFHRSEDHVVYEIAIKDVVTGSTRHEALRFDVFTSTAVKKARALSDLQDNSSGPYKNVRAAGAPQLQEFIEKNLADLKNMHRRLMGLENYFQSTAVPMEVRSMMKPCSLNLKNLKTTIGDTLRAMNEFKSRKEEEAQLKKLGIQD